jgi:hypothetical protein
MENEKIDILNVEESNVTAINVDKLPHLRPKLIRFCEGILQGKTQAQAYTDAGFKAKNENVSSVKACNLLKDGNIKTYINIRENHERIKLEKQTNVSRFWVLSKYKEVVDRCSQDVIPMTDKKGQPILIEDKEGKLCQAFVFNSKGVVAGLDGIARVQGYNAPQKIENTDTAQQFDVSTLRPDDLVNLSKRLKQLETGVSPTKSDTKNPNEFEKVESENIEKAQ